MAKWELTKTVRFEASHVLPRHGGKCSRLHGHSWVVEVTVHGNRLDTSGPSMGMLMDFGDVAAPVDRLVRDKLDHYHLNDSTGLEHPTSEALARWLYINLQVDLPLLHSVTVHETCTCRATYRE